MAKDPTFPTDLGNYAPWVSLYGLTEPYGKCQCGCGNDVSISMTNNAKAGRCKGKPSRFFHGHNVAIDPTDRFWKSVKIGNDSDCWEWQAGKMQAGYGVIGVGRKILYTHRYSYELHNGPIPKGFFVCHHCDNPPCCNPDHLFLGTDRDNKHDMIKKGRNFIPAPRLGENHFGAKLTDNMVREIRIRSNQGEIGTALAREFGVRPAAISAIIRRRSWTHVE